MPTIVISKVSGDMVLIVLCLTIQDRYKNDRHNPVHERETQTMHTRLVEGHGKKQHRLQVEIVNAAKSTELDNAYRLSLSQAHLIPRCGVVDYNALQCGRRSVAQ